MDTVALYKLLLDQLATDSLENIIKAAADFLHQHVTCLDNSYNVLASWPQELINDPYWDIQQTYGYVPEEHMKQIFESKYPDATFKGVTYITWGNINYMRCAVTLQHNGKSLGHVSLYHTDPCLSREEVIEAVTCLNYVLTIFFLRNNQITTSSETIMSALASQLFSGQKVTRAFEAEWHRISGNPLRGKYFIAALSPSNKHNSILEFLSMRLRLIHRYITYVEKENYCYVLFYNILSEQVLRNIQAHLSDYLMQYGLHCGISEPFDNIDDIQTYIYQSRKAIKIGISNHEEELLHLFENLRTEIMLDYITENMEVANFTHPLFAKLVSDDEKNNTQYFQTLLVYLNSICDSALAAKALSIHRNTVLYRINHIIECYEYDLNDPAVIKDLSLSAWVWLFYKEHEKTHFAEDFH